MHLFSFIPLALLLQQSIAFNSEENALQLNFEDECSMMVCRAGRECQLSGNGEASCVCMASCPDHFVPVCGSNGRSYDNYCMMHRDACLSGIHISLRSSGYCSDEKTSTIDDESLFEPVVCFQWERDALRRQILSHFRQHTIDGSWYSKPGGYNKHEKLRARFNKCDTSDDTFVDANELAACVADVPFALRTTQTSNKLVKVLCVDAIVDAGDVNSDWRLDFEEYKALLDSNFEPKKKLCSLEGKRFEDGSQTKVDCNECVCACGSWVCSSKTCQQQQEMEHDRLNEIDQLLDKDEEDEIMNDDVEEDEDEEDLSEVNKIFKIEEDDAMIDPDEDEFVPRYTNFDDYDEDEAFDDDQAMMDYLYDYDDKAEKRKKSKSGKSHRRSH